MGSGQSGGQFQETWHRLRRCGTRLDDEQAITIRADEAGEERYVTVGMDPAMRILVVVYTWRDNRPRLISARQATPREQYETNQ